MKGELYTEFGDDASNLKSKRLAVQILDANDNAIDVGAYSYAEVSPSWLRNNAINTPSWITDINAEEGMRFFKLEFSKDDYESASREVSQSSFFFIVNDRDNNNPDHYEPRIVNVIANTPLEINLLEQLESIPSITNPHGSDFEYMASLSASGQRKAFHQPIFSQEGNAYDVETFFQRLDEHDYDYNLYKDNGDFFCTISFASDLVL